MKILETKHEIDVLNVEQAQSKINTNKLQKAFELLSSIYKNPIKSVIREYTSNAVDANVENNSTNPVAVFYTKIVDDYYFNVRDYGTGMSKQFMQDIYFNYLETTKEDSDDFIGGFGIGAKSIFSYNVNSVLFVETIYNGVKYVWTYYKDENNIPSYTLMSEMPTTELSGTLVRFKIECNDYSVFLNTSNNILRYIDNIILLDIDKTNLFEHNEVTEFKYFKTTCDNDSSIVLLLGNIVYDVDYNEIAVEYKDKHIQIAVKFGIDELTPSYNRETFYYNASTRKFIQDRVDAAIKEVYSIQKAQAVIDIPNIEPNQFTHGITCKDKVLDMPNPIEQNYKSLVEAVPSFVPTSKFSVLVRYRRVYTKHYGFKGNYNGEDKIIVADSKSLTQRNRKLYCNIEFADKNIILLIKNTNITLNIYRRILGLYRVPKKDWRKLIIAHQKLEQLALKDSIEFETIKITPEWKLAHSEHFTKNYTSGFKYKNYVPGTIIDVTTESETSELQALIDFKGIIIYGMHDDKAILLAIKKVLKRWNYKNNIKVISMSKKYYTQLEKLDNPKFLNVSEFNGKFYKLLRNIATAEYLHATLDIENVFEDNKILNMFNTSISNEVYLLEQFLDKYLINSYYTTRVPFRKILLNAFIENNDLNEEILEKFKKIKKYYKFYSEVVVLANKQAYDVEFYIGIAGALKYKLHKLINNNKKKGVATDKDLFINPIWYTNNKKLIRKKYNLN